MKTKKDLVLIEDFSIIFNKVIYECKINSFAFNGKKITNWKSTGIFNYSNYYTMNGIEDTKKICHY